MPSLDLLERKLMKIFNDTNQVQLKRRFVRDKNKQSYTERTMTVEEKRELISLFLRRIDSLPEEKRKEVFDLLRLYDVE